MMFKVQVAQSHTILSLLYQHLEGTKMEKVGFLSKLDKAVLWT